MCNKIMYLSGIWSVDILTFVQFLQYNVYHLAWYNITVLL